MDVTGRIVIATITVSMCNRLGESTVEHGAAWQFH